MHTKEAHLLSNRSEMAATAASGQEAGKMHLPGFSRFLAGSFSARLQQARFAADILEGSMTAISVCLAADSVSLAGRPRLNIHRDQVQFSTSGSESPASFREADWFVGRHAGL